jgi:hypothetical protein
LTPLEGTLTIKIGTIPIEATLSARKLISDNSGLTYEIVCLTRFTGFDKLRVGTDLAAVSAGKQTVIGKIVLAEGTIGHVELIAAALATARDNLKRIKQDRVFHVDSLSVSVA